MKIAIDVSPLEENRNIAHKVRGTGFYLQNLKRFLLKYHIENEYIFFTRGEKLPNNVDLVHYPYFEPFFLTLPFKKKFKTVITVHDLTPLVFPEHFPSGIKGKIKWVIQKKSLRKADAIITDSESSKKDIIKFTGVNEDKIHVIYLAAGEEYKKVQSSKLKVKSLRARYQLPEKFVLYVGDATWNKNLPRLVQAIKKVNIPLVLVGKALSQKEIDITNPWNKDLVTVQKLINEDKNIITLGFIPTEELVTIYNMATVFVMPSLYEGFGLPILESMQSGCPVITSKEGSIPEIAGDSAYFVDAYSADSIAEGISKVFSNEKIRKELSKNGIENAKKFSWVETAKKTNTVYKKVFNKNKNLVESSS